MGVLLLVFEGRATGQTLGLKGDETVTTHGLGDSLKPRQTLRADGRTTRAPLACRIATLDELEDFRNGGILSYVLRQLAT
jgi:aconitate hydratase A / 2-methylisocitrate dehydratase